MMPAFFRLAAEQSLGFVVTSLVICAVAGWLLATMLRTTEAATKPAHRRRWLTGTAIVAGLSVWTIHFIAMLGYRADLLLSFDGPMTVLSALISILLVGIPFAASARVNGWQPRALLGGLAGLGISAMHYAGMEAIESCVRSQSIAATLLASLVAACSLGAARGVPDLARSKLATCTLFMVAVGGAHFIAIAGTTVSLLDGASAHPYENIVLSIFTAAGAAVLFLGAFATILTAKRFEAQERAHSTILRTSLNNMSNGLVYFDASGKLGLINRRFVEMCQLRPDLLAVGMTRSEVLDAIAGSMGWSAERRRMVEACFDRWTVMDDAETDEYTTSDGKILEVNSCMVEEGGVVLTFDDVTKDRHAQRRIEDLAFVDPLTKLANRRAFQKRIDEEFQLQQWCKLLLIDLDRFKAVNDTYGHGVGDKLLMQVAERIRGVIGTTGFAARLGGDELAVIVHGDLDLSMTVANEIIDAIGRPFPIDGLDVSVGCSIGMCCTDDARDVTELMQRSDVALYESKRHGRGRASCYRPGMLEAVAERQMLENDMRGAIERGEFHLAYQPVLALRDDRIIGYEALIRWDHPKLGAVPPARFIPLAEETGQIVEIGRWVLEEACREAASWNDGRYVAVNVSAVQFRSPLLLSHLTKVLAMSGLPARRLEVELTETAIVEDGNQIASSLQAIRALGVRIAMDDFGTGYSSLSHLRDFPLDRIKVDRSFTATAETDRHSLAVLRGITQIAQELDIDILAEGVETRSQLDLIRSIGCGAIQGYLVGKPERLLQPMSVDERLSA